MFHNRVRLTVSVSLGLAAALLFQSGPLTAQNAQKNGPTLSFGSVRLSNYSKVTGGLNGNLSNGSVGLHIEGKGTTLEYQEKNRALHRLQAAEIRINRTANGYNGELNGNIHYMQLLAPTDSKLIDGTAERALYKQSGTDGAAVTLMKAHISLFREGNEIAVLNAGQVVANQQSETVVATGSTHVTAHVLGNQVEVTADQITWDRRANTILASGKAHIAYTDSDKKTSASDSESIKIDLKNLSFELK